MYIEEPVPTEYDPEFLQRELRRISEAFQTVHDLTSSLVPGKPRAGMLRYFDGTRGDPGAGEGLYIRLSTGWTKV